jgi:gluconolactonase
MLDSKDDGQMRVWGLILCALNLAFSSQSAQSADGSPVRRLDPSVDALVAADARLETLFERNTTFEGPTWVRDGGSGYLIFSDVPGNVIDKLNPDGRVSPFLENIFAGKERSEAFQSFGLNGQEKFWMLGANGVTLDRQGRVVYCAYSDGQIVRLETDGRRTILASRYGASRLNAPNDLVYKSDGSLYFTDSRASSRRADGEGVPHKGLYVLRSGEVRLLSKDIDHPNGLAFSPDEKHLYVTNSLLGNVLRFDVRAAGIANERVFVDMSSDKGVGRPDGIKVDKRGNVYSTGPGGVWIMSPSGRHIGTILAPGQVNNLTFGGNDLRTLYMAGFGALYRIPLKVAGK